MNNLADTLGRPMRSLRLSVTDRCDLRCRYCMPEEEYVWLPRESILEYEELATLVDVFTGFGVERVRLTGGEPLLRRDLDVLVRTLAEKPGVRDLAMTTNGLQLARYAEPLQRAGLRRVTVSLDTLREERFEYLTGRPRFDAVMEGIRASLSVGFDAVKINAVVMRGFNDDELCDMVEFGRESGVEVRFIEYMDVGGATTWKADTVVTRVEMLQSIGRRFGRVEPCERTDSAPADRFRLPDGTIFGIISSTSEPFCASCDRSRLTADGQWYTCLYAAKGVDLKTPLRSGANARELSEIIASVWKNRADRGAEERLNVSDRTAFVPVSALKGDSRLEMHTRGG